MPKFIIERNIPGANTLSPQELRDISAKSNAVVAGLGEPYSWITSYVAGDKIYCVHEAKSAEAIYKHARDGGFTLKHGDAAPHHPCHDAVLVMRRLDGLHFRQHRIGTDEVAGRLPHQASDVCDADVVDSDGPAPVERVLGH